jgi:Na+-driven multidrug efflux pump
MTTAAVTLCLIFAKPLIALFGGTAEAQSLALQILVLYGVCSCFFYPTSFAVASALRGTGDTKFVMVFAILSMFLFRIGAAYIFVHVFNMGVIGTWVAMVSDWVLRTIIFLIRFLSGKWQKNKVI